MINKKLAVLAASIGLGLSSFYAISAPQCGTDSRCHYTYDRAMSSCMNTTNPVVIDGVRYDRYNTRAECDAVYSVDLQRCLAGDTNGPGAPSGCN
ncbi:hypothetical protein [Shewanella violacea]|uniref:Uncharacterized protein n=1 Tax=Shewanella violacea (strain JCM 10179 / CIP 106290 / LMG 19151 / DSS12) TaxID=637905 RepID=D4ZBX9_SHEVD|nr:hypothetical protein [Shewanella violacea]BAJ03524.1 hypothetical protein SVI_3553 [Shewanella violacea DSS12]